jgi:hypothetical protein
MVWLEPAALSVRVRTAVRNPKTLGEKVRETEQLAPAATLAPHVLVTVKSAAFEPDTIMLTMSKVPEPVLEIVITFAALGAPSG